jgi:hypothetical protein
VNKLNSKTPRAKASVLREYIFFSKAYGGINRGLPTLYFSWTSSDGWTMVLENPKSPIFHVPF